MAVMMCGPLLAPCHGLMTRSTGPFVTVCESTEDGTGLPVIPAPIREGVAQEQLHDGMFTTRNIPGAGARGMAGATGAAGGGVKYYLADVWQVAGGKSDHVIPSLP